MPKVTEKYMEEKRRMIVDCAYQVCLRKPVEMVTISDVIAETGMSQGAIYRYYTGLDEILADMATKMRSDYNIIDSFEQVLSDKKATIEELTYRVCDLLADAMESHLMDIQKINFDLGVLTINEPERAAKIMSGIKGTGNLEYLEKNAMPRLIEGAYKSGYHPVAAPEDIGLFISAGYTGIEKFCIMSACYGTCAPNAKAEPHKLFRTLADSIIHLLGGKTNG
ncbi:MAG: TetR/AcrR family transcriptional regulator [Saccharofermentans sp.]|nr:TetR/AcrR family transcriptional regulator [Saccharofermentans sp.]